MPKKPEMRAAIRMPGKLQGVCFACKHNNHKNCNSIYCKCVDEKCKDGQE